MRHCKIAPPSCTRPGAPCCADCKDKACPSRCLNNPGHCGCWEGAPPVRLSGGKKRTSQLRTDKMLELHKQGLLQREIAQRMGCSVSTVSAALRKMGVKRYG